MLMRLRVHEWSGSGGRPVQSNSFSRPVTCVSVPLSLALTRSVTVARLCVRVLMAGEQFPWRMEWNRSIALPRGVASVGVQPQRGRG